MPNKKYYCDNEITGEPMYRDVNRFYPVEGLPDDPPILIQAMWIIGFAVAGICAVVFLFGAI